MPVKRRRIVRSRNPRPVKRSRAYRPRGTKRPRPMESSGIARKVDAMYRMIETKEGSVKTGTNVSLAHNNVTLVQNSVGAVFNPIFAQQGIGDPMGANNGHRIGDKITIRGLMVRAFMENALERTKVYY